MSINNDIQQVINNKRNQLYQQVMTTISNFLQCSFIDNPSIQSNQNPIWILNTQSFTYQPKILKDYIINNANQSSKPLIHIDLGLSLVKKYKLIRGKGIKLQNGMEVYQVVQGKPYFVVGAPVKERIKKGFLTSLIHNINHLHQSKILKSKLNQMNLPKKYQNKFCLLVQGLQAMLLIQKGKQVEQFISKLSNLDGSIRQISILSQQRLINKQIMFVLQRISTCLTTLTCFNPLQLIWQCQSTVRRYTGYSNQQTYLLQKSISKIKVSKKLHIIDLSQTKQQKQMVNSLGFVVKRDQQDKKKQEQMMQRIFPHLRMRQYQGQAKTCGNQCDKAQCCSKQDQGLIVLDDQQEDQDDVDV